MEANQEEGDNSKPMMKLDTQAVAEISHLSNNDDGKMSR